jgi:hypothetical protein
MKQIVYLLLAAFLVVPVAVGCDSGPPTKPIVQKNEAGEPAKAATPPPLPDPNKPR